MTDRRRVLVIGYYGDGNVGDEAILSEIVRSLRRDRENVDVIVPCYGPDPGRLEAAHGVTSFSMEDLDRILHAVESADLVLLGGGGLLHDIWYPRPETMLTSQHFGLSYYCGVAWLAAQFGKPVMLYGVGVGPLVYDEGKALVRDASNVAQTITVRDSGSAALLQELGITGVPIEVTADPAWRISPSTADRGTALLAEAGAVDGRWIGVALRNWNLDVDQARWEEHLLSCVEGFAQERGLGVLFLPFQHGRFMLQDDVGLAQGLAARLSRVQSAVLDQPHTAQDLLAAIGRCELIIGMRLHALIFGCMVGTPAVALSYDPKVALLAAAVEPPVPAIAIQALTVEVFQASLRQVWAARSERSRGQKALALRMRERAARNSALAVSLLADPPGRLPRASRDRIFGWVRGREAARTAGSDWTIPQFEERTEAQHEIRSTLELTVQQPVRDVARIVVPQFLNSIGEVVFGGAERYLLELSALIRRMGFEVEVLQPSGEGAWVRHFRDLRIEAVPAATVFEVERTVYQSGAPRVRLTIHLTFASAGPYTIPPAIGISHGVFWDDPYYHASADRWQWHRDRLLEAVRRLDAVISVDTNTANWVAATAPDLADRLLYIPNFVDLGEFRPEPQPHRSNLVVLFPRRLVTARGFWVLAEIVPDLLAAYPQLQFHFVGHASGAEEQAVRDLLEVHAGRVRWDVVPPERMPQMYRAADIVVIPTQYAEGTSLACLEAQASGKAVIATRVGGLADLIFDGYNGLLVEPNPASIRAALERLVQDDTLRLRLVERALETVRLFDIERWRDRWERVLRTFLPARVMG